MEKDENKPIQQQLLNDLSELIEQAKQQVRHSSK